MGRGRPRGVKNHSTSKPLAEQLERFRHVSAPDGVALDAPAPAYDPHDDPPAPESRFYSERSTSCSDAHLLRLREFAYRIIVLGEGPAVAALNVGWSAAKGYRERTLPRYAEVRAELLREYGQKREAALNEIYAVVTDSAYHGAVRQNEMVHTSDDNRLVNDIANQAMDRVGARAAAKVDQRVTIELSPETAALIAKAHAVASMPRVPLEESEWAYALERPSVGTQQARELIGTAQPQPDDTSE